MNVRSEDRRETRKSVLYCPDCGHESPILGDWVVRELGDATMYACPDCGTVIASRPAESTGDVPARC